MKDMEKLLIKMENIILANLKTDYKMEKEYSFLKQEECIM